MTLKLKALSATAAAVQPVYIEDVFSTYLYTGNGSTQTITNGIDLAGEGGLVWIKSRNNTTVHYLQDTERGANYGLVTSTTAAQALLAIDFSFDSTGFSQTNNNASFNQSYNYASWTFRKAPRFFDVVTYTGNGSAQSISHNLGSVPGCIIVKQTGGTTNWSVYHRSMDASAPEDYYMALNLTNSRIGPGASQWNSTAPTDTQFTVGTGTNTNASGGTYVAYLFAHDPLGPSEDGSDGLIACGSYTGNGSTDGPEIDLGWEPQWVMIKNATTSGEQWLMVDNMRGWPTGAAVQGLYANSANAEFTGAFAAMNLLPTGFQPVTTDATINKSGDNYIYIAIRRGPMREPTSGTEVFAPVTRNSSVGGVNYYTGFPVDLSIFNVRTSPGNYFHTRLTATKRLQSVNTAAEISGDAVDFTSNVGYQPGTSSTTTNALTWNFRRAPGFFDVVAYTGDGVAGRTVPHNLGVAPEMMIVKNRGDIRDWIVYHSALGATYLAELNTTAAAYQNSSYWPSVPTDSVFSPGNASATNRSGYNHIAYLFATLAGVSKVGSYTGNGSSQTINCGFTSGARFILIKRTDSTGDWYVWDTARGIVSGNDPHLSLNTTAAEVTSDDTIDPDSSGFIVNQVTATNVNVSSASYIYLAIA